MKVSSNLCYIIAYNLQNYSTTEKSAVFYSNVLKIICPLRRRFTFWIWIIYLKGMAQSYMVSFFWGTPCILKTLLIDSPCVFLCECSFLTVSKLSPHSSQRRLIEFIVCSVRSCFLNSFTQGFFLPFLFPLCLIPSALFSWCIFSWSFHTPLYKRTYFCHNINFTICFKH